MSSDRTLSVVIPTYHREKLLVNTVRNVVKLLRPHDELLVIDQTPRHEPETFEALRSEAESGKIRWYIKRQPSQNEAMNVAALLARGEVLLFLDDDVVPSEDLLEGHREAFADPSVLATCGQVLQPWHTGPIQRVVDYRLRFDPAYDRPCRIVSLIGANWAIRKQTYLDVGGMDENYRGSNYRNDAEMAFRLVAQTRREILFVPKASLRHLYAGGGNRAYGEKDTWGHIGGSIGDYYFAFRSLPTTEMVKHCLCRLLRAPISRNTLRRPWLIPSLALREGVALHLAAHRALRRKGNYAKSLESYRDLREPIHARGPG